MAFEAAVEGTVCNHAEEEGWYQRKLRWLGRRGGNDRFFAKGGRVVLIEFKDTGKKPEPLHAREHERLRKAGVEVYTIDNVRDGWKALGLKGH